MFETLGLVHFIVQCSHLRGSDEISWSSICHWQVSMYAKLCNRWLPSPVLCIIPRCAYYHLVPCACIHICTCSLRSCIHAWVWGCMYICVHVFACSCFPMQFFLPFQWTLQTPSLVSDAAAVSDSLWDNVGMSGVCWQWSPTCYCTCIKLNYIYVHNSVCMIV